MSEQRTLRVAFVTSHPIQYQLPVFRCLAARDDLDLTVLFAMLPDAATQGAGFGVAFEWDLPLLEGYGYRILNNVSASPGVTHFQGCDTPDVGCVLRDLAIDVVVVNGWVVKSCLQTLRACKRLGIPCIVRGEANDLRPRAAWKRWLQARLVQRYDAVLPIGQASREFYRRRGVATDRMFDSPYCVDNDRFARAAQQARPRRSRLRARWNIPADAVCYLYCGKFETKKHPLELVDAFLQAHRSRLQSADEGHPIHLLMVGDGELRAECESRLARHSPPPAPCSSPPAPRPSPVTFAGFLNQSEIVDAYVAADCLVLPSDHGETWGLVVNEAFACGRPAIVSDQVGCAADLVHDGETGFVFPFGDWDGLARLIERGAGAECDFAAMGESARELIQAYSPQAAAEGIARAVKSGERGAESKERRAESGGRRAESRELRAEG